MRISQIDNSLVPSFTPINNQRKKSIGAENYSIPLEITTIIKELPIFATVNQNSEFIDNIARMMQIRSFQSGDHIIRQGEEAKAMFFLIRGNVDVVSEDHEIVFASLAHPSYFGEIALLFDIKRTANVIATTKCLVAVLKSEKFHQCIVNYEQVGLSIKQEAKLRFFALAKDLKSQGKILNEEHIGTLDSINSSDDEAPTSKELLSLSLTDVTGSNSYLNSGSASLSSLSSPTTIVAQISPLFSPQLDSPSMVNQFLSTNSMAPRRASVAVWADNKLMQMVASINKKPEQKVNRMDEMKGVSFASLYSICWSKEDCLDQWELGDLSNLPPNALKKLFGYLSIESIAKLRQTSSVLKQLTQQLVQSEILNTTYSNLDMSKWNKNTKDHTISKLIEFCGTHVMHLSLKNCWSVTDIGIKSITLNLPSLVTLNLSSVWEISDASLALISKHAPCLTSLNLSNCRKITDTGLLSILDGCTCLIELQLSYCKCITSATFNHPTWHTLEKLNLQRCTNVRDQAFLSWKTNHDTDNQFYKLKELCLADCSFLTDSAIESLVEGCPELFKLSLSFCCSLTPSSITLLSNLKLQELDVSFCGCAVTDESMKIICTGFSELTFLNVRGCSQITMACIESLNANNTIKTINISQCAKIVNPSFESIQQTIETNHMQ